MNSYQKIKDQIKKMFDESTDKTVIEQVGALNSLVDNAEEEHKALKKENKELLDDYKEALHHSSFQPNGTEDPTQQDKPVSIESCLYDVLKQNQK